MKWVIDHEDIAIAVADFVSKQIGRKVWVNVEINIHSKNCVPEKVEAIVTEKNGETK